MRNAMIFSLALPLLAFCGQACLAQSMAPDNGKLSTNLPGLPAVRDGWVEKAFDFAAPGLDFKAQVPKGAQVATAPMPARDAGSIGKLTIIGKMQPNTGEEVPIDVSIVGYDLRTAGSAARLCRRVHEESGYLPSSEDVSPQQSEAFIAGMKFRDDKPVEGIFSRCITRGKQALGVHFLYDLGKAENDKQISAIRKAAQDYAQTFVRSMLFENGQNGGYWDGVKPVPVRVDGKVFDVRIPDDWQVPINDFDGRATAELHILRQEGAITKGGVWFTAGDLTEKPDLDRLGREAIPLLVKAQSKEFGMPVLKDSAAGPDFSGDGSLVQTFLFAMSGEDGVDQGTVRALMIWHAGRLYLLANWSPYVQDGSQNAFFSTLPGLTIYDALVSVIEDVVPKRM